MRPRIHFVCHHWFNGSNDGVRQLTRPSQSLWKAPRYRAFLSVRWAKSRGAEYNARAHASSRACWHNNNNNKITRVVCSVHIASISGQVCRSISVDATLVNALPPPLRLVILSEGHPSGSRCGIESSSSSPAVRHHKGWRWWDRDARNTLRVAAHAPIVASSCGITPVHSWRCCTIPCTA